MTLVEFINSKSEHHPKTNYAATHAEYLKTVIVKQVEDAVTRASNRRTKMTLGWNKTANFFIGQTLYYSKYLDQKSSLWLDLIEAQNCNAFRQNINNEITYLKR